MSQLFLQLVVNKRFHKAERKIFADFSAVSKPLFRAASCSFVVVGGFLFIERFHVTSCRPYWCT